MPRQRLILAISLSIIGFIVSAITSYLYFRPSPPIIAADTTSAPTLPPPISPDPSQQTLGIVLLGYGGPGHQGGYLTDAIQVVYFDFQASKVALISLPRDLYLKYPDGISRKINAVFAAKTRDTPYPKEGLELNQAKTAFKDIKPLVSGLTGLPVDYAIGVDFVGFQRLIGGVLSNVTIDNPEPLDDAWYPIRGEELNPCGLTHEEITHLTATLSGFNLEKQFPCRYERVIVPEGKQTLDGGTALKYARSRHSSSDFARSRRQQAVLIGVRDRLFSLESLKDIPKWYQAITQHVATDIDLEFVQKIAGNLTSIKDTQITTINLSTENVFTSSKASSGAYIVLPRAGANNFTQVQAYIASQLESTSSASLAP